MKKVFIVILLIIVLSSCSSNRAFYNITLNDVVCLNEKISVDESNIVNVFNVKENSTSKYEDRSISIVWELQRKQLCFALENRKEIAIKILWDEAVYVDEANQSYKLMHVGVDYAGKNEKQSDAILAPMSKINETVVPSKNIYPVNGEYGGWVCSNLLKRDKASLLGERIKVLLPIEVKGKRSDYYFTFNISSKVKS